MSEQTRPRRLTALEGLTVALYLLMRDATPTGEVARVADLIAETRGKKVGFEFSSPELAALAERYARMIMNGKAKMDAQRKRSPR